MSFNSLFFKLRSSKLAKDSIIYIVSEGIAKSIPFLLLPVLSYYLTPSDYGIVTNFNVFTQILSVLTYSIFLVILQAQYYKLSKDERQKFISTLIWTSTIFVIILLIITLFTTKFLTKYLDLNEPALIIGILNVWMCCIMQTLLVIWRCEGLSIKFGIVHISQSALDITLSVIFVIYMSMGWQGRVWGIVISDTALGILCLYIMIHNRYLRFVFSKSDFSKIILFSLPLLPHGLSFWIKSGADKILLTNISGINANGLYSVALTFGAIISITISAFNNAYIPNLFKKLTDIEANPLKSIEIKTNVVHTTKILALIMGVFCILTYFVSYLFIELVYEDSYHSAIRFLPWIIIAQFLYGLYSLMVNFIHFSQKTKLLGITTFSLSIAQVGISYFLIKELGPIGAPISSAIIAFFIMFCVTLISMHTYKLPWFTNSKAQ